MRGTFRKVSLQTSSISLINQCEFDRKEALLSENRNKLFSALAGLISLIPAGIICLQNDVQGTDRVVNGLDGQSVG